MKWFSLLLLIANVGLAAWGYLTQAPTEMASVPLETTSPAGRRLLLLSEAERGGYPIPPNGPDVVAAAERNMEPAVTTAPPAVASVDAAPAPGGDEVTFQKMVDPQPAPVNEQEFAPGSRPNEALIRSASGIAKVFSDASSQSVATVSSEPTTAASDTRAPASIEGAMAASQYCVSLGPLAKRVDADRVQQLLAPLDLTGQTLRTEASASKNGYWVVVPAHASIQEAKQRVAALEAAGISGIWRFTKGTLANAISLGLFSQRDNAERYAREIADKGFPTEVVPRTEEKDVYWLDCARNQKPVVPADTWSQLTSEFPELTQENKPCANIVSR